jgi:hypothetical protein
MVGGISESIISVGASGLKACHSFQYPLEGYKKQEK